MTIKRHGAQVLVHCVVFPLDLARDKPNLAEGDSLSGSPHLA